MKAKTIDTTKKEKKPEIVRIASQFPDATPTTGQHHNGSDIQNLVEKQKQRDREKSKQSLINDILKGNFQPAYSKKDPADLSQALKQVKAKMNGKAIFRKAKQANALLIYSMNGDLLESVNLNRRGYYSESIKYWFSRSQSLSEIATKYTEISDQPVFCKRIAINDYHYRQYVIKENVVNTINDCIDGITVYKNFSIFSSGVILVDKNNNPVVLDSLELAKEFVKSL